MRAWISKGLLVLAVLAVGSAAPGATLSAQSAGTNLGSVRIPKAVKANGETLPAGTYTVRLTNDSPKPAVGLTPDAEKWVEFLQGGKVVGKEIASVVTSADIKAVAEMTPPASGSAKVQLLKGSDYVRVWLNKGGTHYLVHLGNQ